MLVYRDINEIPPPMYADVRASPAQPDFVRPEMYADRRVEEEPEPLPVEEMDIPPDPDGGNPGALDDLLRAGPSILDQMMSAPAPAAAAPSYRQAAPQRTYRSNRGPQPVVGPGSLTRVVGVNDMAIGGNTLGDGRGNVLRENMRHFGIVGTRAR